MKQIDTIALQGSIDDMRSRIASEQCAMHKVQLAVARWRGALATPTRDARTQDDAPCPASQVHWHAQAQCHFMSWLEQGGFSQAQAEDDEQPAPADGADGANGVSAQPQPAASSAAPAHCNGCAV